MIAIFFGHTFALQIGIGLGGKAIDIRLDLVESRLPRIDGFLEVSHISQKFHKTIDDSHGYDLPTTMSSTFRSSGAVSQCRAILWPCWTCDHWSL